MSRVLGIIFALTLTTGGALWLLVQIIMPEYASRNLVVAACIVFAMGAHWLWTDYVHPTSGQEDRAYCPLTETPPPLPAHLPMRMSPGSLVTSADPRGCCGSPSVPAYDSGRDASRVLFIRPALFFGKPDRVSTLPNDGFRPTHVLISHCGNAPG